MSVSNKFIKTPAQVEGIRRAARLSMQIMQQLQAAIKPGVSTAEIDELAGKLCKENNAIPAFKGVVQTAGPFPANICISINDQVLHAIPSTERIFASGDLVKLDFGIKFEGYFTDHCISFGIGELSAEDERLLKTGKLAVETGVKKAIVGNNVGEIGAAIHSVCTMAGFDVLKEFIGHGIGLKLHEEPEVFAYGSPLEGPKLEAGLVLCIEAQVVAGDDDIYIAEDGWTVYTRDGAQSVMFEYMVLVTPQGPEILTDTRDWPLIVK